MVSKIGLNTGTVTLTEGIFILKLTITTAYLVQMVKKKRTDHTQQYASTTD